MPKAVCRNEKQLKWPIKITGVHMSTMQAIEGYTCAVQIQQTKIIGLEANRILQENNMHDIKLIPE